MEVGSFFELQFPKGMEFYQGDRNVARLNTGRAAIWHAIRVIGNDTIWLPYYQCDSVRSFLKEKGVQIKYYHIDRHFNPTDLYPDNNETVLLVNYYGIMSNERMKSLARQYNHVIVDNSQAFFCKPIDSCMNVYSCRKFIGVPDGAYVIGENAEKYLNSYEQSFSSDTSIFLLQRIEYGCEGKAYQSRQINEHRIDTEDCMRMSELTHTILDGTNYELIVHKRKENYQIARNLFDTINCINSVEYYDNDVVPMIYPLVIESDDLLEKLLRAKHFQGHWWSYICDELPSDSFEYWISKYIIPITIDQRYGRDDLTRLYRCI